MCWKICIRMRSWLWCDEYSGCSGKVPVHETILHISVKRILNTLRSLRAYVSVGDFVPCSYLRLGPHWRLAFSWTNGDFSLVGCFWQTPETLDQNILIHTLKCVWKQRLQYVCDLPEASENSVAQEKSLACEGEVDYCEMSVLPVVRKHIFHQAT